MDARDARRSGGVPRLVEHVGLRGRVRLVDWARDLYERGIRPRNRRGVARPSRARSRRDGSAPRPVDRARVFGLRIGKWVHNVGASLLLGTFVVLIVLAFVGHGHAAQPFARALPLSMPRMNVFGLAILGRMSAGALSGFDYTAIFAGEGTQARSPRAVVDRNRSTDHRPHARCWAPGALLVYSAPADVDLISPIPQAFRAAFGGGPEAHWVRGASILVLTLTILANAAIEFAGVARVPMVAGWARALPSWFSSLHRSYKTPHHSILVVGAGATALGIAATWDVGSKEGRLDCSRTSSAAPVDALTYTVLFSLPFVLRRTRGSVVPRWLLVASASGLILTVLYIALSAYPITAVGDRTLYASKIVGFTIGVNLVGGIVLTAGRRTVVR